MRFWIVGSVIASMAVLSAMAVAQADMGRKQAWVQSQLLRTEGAPFSFAYRNRASDELLPTWKRTAQQKKLDENRIQHTITWVDDVTGLEVRCDAIEYVDFPTVEWVLHLRNTGATDTPIISDIQAMDLRLERSGGEFTLHHNAGSQASSDDYRPLVTLLKSNSNLRLACVGGRGSDSVWPYFNVEWAGEGAIAVIGWPGQWAATFARDGANGLSIRAGQEKTNFKLLPGEEVRSPLAVVEFYRGDWITGQNIWRRWMIAHNLPRLDGKLPPLLLAASSAMQLSEMQNANEENQKQFIDAYVKNGIKLDFWWMDAGWYPFKAGWWEVGTWQSDRRRFPNGLRAVSDHAHRNGVKTLLWFEPERVTVGSALYREHPRWLLGPDGQQKLLDLGNTEARQWVIDHVDKTMQAEGIDIYRQDFNFPPLGYWRNNDAPDRQGITEIRHVTGYLAFWDELRRRHPGLLIDTCASGGRRNDLETLRRSVPLHKSDMSYPNLTAKQTQLHGLALWVPYFGAAAFPTERVDKYGFRSAVSLMTGLGYDVRRNDVDWALLRKLVEEWRAVAPNLWGDFYPLLPWSFDEDVWIAWQFDRPGEGGGMVQAFRRTRSIYESARVRLRGLEPAAMYRVRNLDAEGETRISGRELMERGLLLNLPRQPSAAIAVYERERAGPGA